MSRLPTVQLPTEVWLVIIEYLSPDEVHRLRCVSRQVLGIVLDIRYKNVRLHDASSEHTRWLVQRLKDPFVSWRVRSLTLRTALFRDIILQEPMEHRPLESISTTFQRGLSSLRRSLLSQAHTFIPPLRSPATTFRQEIVEVVSNLTNVVRHRLQSLRLNVQLESMREILIPPQTFPQLSTISLTLSKCFQTTDSAAIMKDVLAPFINRHTETLESFTLSAFNHFNYSALLHPLHHFPTLSKLNISYPSHDPLQCDLSGLSHLLTLHSAHLRELRIAFFAPMERYSGVTPNGSWHTHPLWKIPLPQLQRFTLRLGMFWQPGPPWLASYLCLFSRTLVEFTLSRYELSKEELIHLVHALSYDGTGANNCTLRSLSLTLGTFYPSTLDLLSRSFSKLETLTLYFVGYSYDTNIHPESLRTKQHIFLGEIKSRTYSSWKLLKLTARPFGHFLPMSSPYRGAFLIAIPSLLVINGEATDEEKDGNGTPPFPSTTIDPVLDW